MSATESTAAEVDAYVLTRQTIETNGGARLVFWCKAQTAVIQVEITDQAHVCFIPQADLEAACRRMGPQTGWHHRAVGLRAFGGAEVEALYFSSQRKLLEARRALDAAGIQLFEPDIRLTDRFLMERFITGPVRLRGVPGQRGGHAFLLNPRMSPVAFEPEFDVVSLDIETSYREELLYSVAVTTCDQERVFMVGSGETGASIEYFSDERSLLLALLSWFEDRDPDLVIGWNIVNFDLDFMERRCRQLRLPFQLGRNRQPVVWRRSADDQRVFAIVPGRVVLDGIELLRTANYRFDSFSLEHVSRELLDKGKLLQGSDRAEHIEELYRQNPRALAEYNLQDCRLVWEIFAKLELIDFARERSRLTGLDMGRPGGSVAAFDYLYLPRLHRQGYVAPARSSQTAAAPSPGGFVLESLPGIYDDVIVLDFKSLYPSIIRTFGIDPLAMAKALASPSENDIEGFRGARFARGVSLLPNVIRELWQARDAAKAASNAALSHAIKIIMNSFYGVLGAPGCRFHDPRLVSSITMRGHEILKQTQALIEQLGYKVIYGDTDSVFVWLGEGFRRESVHATGGQLVHQLNRWWREQLKASMDLESCLEIEYETHYVRFFMPKVRGSDVGSKKRYAGLIKSTSSDEDESGYRLVCKGLESVRSDWSELARSFQRELYVRILLDQPYEEFVRATVRAVLQGDRDQDLELRKRLRRPLRAYERNVPPHAQAARKLENNRRQLGLKPAFDRGGWVRYVMTVNGPEPAELRTSGIDYDFYLEKQLAPVADAILAFKATSMRSVLGLQMELF